MNMDLSKFRECQVLVVGDLMIDAYVWGQVDRISPEAPVQIVTVNREEFTLGGAGNVINNLVALGARVSAVGAIGTGADGDRLLKMCDDLCVDTTGIIREPNRPTTRKTRVIAENQHVLRIDRETKEGISAAGFDEMKRFIEARIPDVDVVLISDYGKGLMTADLLASLTAAARNHGKMTIVDPKGVDFAKYSGASLLTPNRKEAEIATGIEIVDEAALIDAGKRILNSVGLDRLLITCGKDGVVLFEGDQEPYKIKAQARQVYDVSGAGDTVAAVLGLAIASGFSYREAATLANTAAGIVVGKLGTATVSFNELEGASETSFSDVALKRIYLPDLPKLVRELRQRGRRIVFTNGCFDLLHAGHIMLFSDSKQLGDVLIVAIDDDDSVRRLKGEGRPVINAGERVRILCALESIDYVLVFPTDDLLNIIEIIRPDIMAKGSNYIYEEVLGGDIVKKHGGEVVLMPVREDTSSTRIIDAIRNGKG
jgi:D-beta-D-heptose 7-phosphate kinase / D-beta-D-heptose 1-phosphate adenosyltransferase